MLVFVYIIAISLGIALLYVLRKNSNKRHRPVIGGAVYLKYKNRSLQTANTRMAEQNYKLSAVNDEIENYRDEIEDINYKISRDHNILKMENVKLNSVNEDLLKENRKLDQKVKGIKTQLSSLAKALKEGAHN